MLVFSFFWLSVSILFMFYSRSLLLSLILLELITFFTMFFFVLTSYSSSAIESLILLLFSLFVIESIIALSGLISLVSFTGSDYLSSSSIQSF